MQYNVHAIIAAGATSDTLAVSAAADGGGNFDTITVPEGATVAAVAAVDDLVGAQFHLYTAHAVGAWDDLGTPAEGDWVAVTGPLVDIPDWQVGWAGVVDADGYAHTVGAGAIAAAFIEVNNTIGSVVARLP